MSEHTEVDNREKKLPVWAQEKINGLRRIALHETEQNELLRAKQFTNETRSAVTVVEGLNTHTKLPSRAGIEFYTSQGRVTARLSRDETEVEINTYDGRLSIRPVVSNSITVKPERR